MLYLYIYSSILQISIYNIDIDIDLGILREYTPSIYLHEKQQYNKSSFGTAVEPTLNTTVLLTINILLRCRRRNHFTAISSAKKVDLGSTTININITKRQKKKKKKSQH